jgi:putative ATP-binding cassette transporter
VANPKPKINRDAIRQFFRVAKPFFVSSERRIARGLIALLIVFSILVSGVNVLMNFAQGKFMTALSLRDGVGFYKYIGVFVASFLAAVPLAVFYRYAEERLALRWREWMSRHLIKRYFYHRAYYHLRSVSEIDNPDQRIAEDVKNFTTTTLSFLLIVLNSIITVIAFAGVLWFISIKLMVVLLAYAVGGTVLTVLIGQRLVRLHFRQYKREATFRYSLIRVRDHAESIAFYRGEPRERLDLGRKLKTVVQNMMRIVRWNRNLGFFTITYNYVALVVPIVVVAPMFLRGEVEFGVITQAMGAFAAILAAISLIILQFERLSQFTAGVTRIGSLWDALHAEVLADEEDDPPIELKEDKRLKLESVTVRTPDRAKDLILDVSFGMKQGEGLLIMGASGSGKSSLLRTIAGLWTSGEGAITRPRLQEMMFLPQRPYMVPGSLRANLMYPAKEKLGEDPSLRKILKQVNLEELLDREGGRLDRVLNWGEVLSLGEQQRVSFARLLYAKPLVAFLDEATSALDEPNEEHLYNLVRESGATYVSVGHRSTLRAFHDRVLVLEPGGQWTVGSANGESPIMQIARDALAWVSQTARKDGEDAQDESIATRSTSTN